LICVGADLEPATLVSAYRLGLFPMPVSRRLAWWSPDPRAVLPLHGVVRSRSLRRSQRRFDVRIDAAFDAVVDGCRKAPRGGGWISPAMAQAYRRLHEMGIAHSVESWSPDGDLVGGLYGVSLGGLFAGESMFHRATDASKVALLGLVDHLIAAGGTRLLDVQWPTPHLGTLGVVAIPRAAYLRQLDAALVLPDAFGSTRPTR
jgi:leucyl/phenylalanyl-tRNA---protein transferase